jgi:hypothetical protein
LALENGAKLTFPWKSQQVITGSSPAYVHAEEVETTGVHRQDVFVAGPVLVSGTAEPYLRLSTAYSDDPFPNGRSVFLTADSTYGLKMTSYTSSSGTLQLTASADNSVFIEAGHVNIGSTRASGGTITIRTTGVGSMVDVVAGEEAALYVTEANGVVQVLSTGASGVVDIQGGLTAKIAATGTSGTAQVLATGTSGVVDIQAGLTLKLTSTGTSGVIEFNPTSDKAVRSNGFPIVPLKGVENAAVGTAPAVNAAAPAYKMIAGRQSVTFSSGAGTVTLAGGGFATGLLTFVATSEWNDFVVAHNKASSTKTAVAVTGFDAGVAAATSYTLDYIAIGW